MAETTAVRKVEQDMKVFTPWTILIASIAATFPLSPAGALICMPGLDEGETPCLDGLCGNVDAGTRCAGINCQPQGVRTTWFVKVTVHRIGPSDTALGEMFCAGQRIAVCATDFFDLDRTCTGSGPSRAGQGRCVLTFIDNWDGVRPSGVIQCTDPLMPENVIEGEVVVVPVPRA